MVIRLQEPQKIECVVSRPPFVYLYGDYLEIPNVGIINKGESRIDCRIHRAVLLSQGSIIFFSFMRCIDTAPHTIA